MTNNEREALKECPFCDKVPYKNTFGVKCGNDKCCMRWQDYIPVIKWNTRAKVDCAPKLTEMQAAIDEFMACRKVDITMSGPILTSTWDASRLFRLWDKLKAAGMGFK